MQKRIDFISLDEFKKLYKAETNKRIKLFMMLSFGSGLRISEILGLYSWESKCCKSEVFKKRIKFKNSGKIARRYFCTACKKILKFSEMKRNIKKWTIPPLTADKIDLQSHQIRLDTAKGGKWRITITPINLTSEHLRLLPLKIKRRTMQNIIKKLAIKVLKKPISCHTLRHGFGNYQANILKTPLPIVQQLMGHTKLETTGIYTRANPQEAVASVWEAMNK